MMREGHRPLRRRGWRHPNRSFGGIAITIESPQDGLSIATEIDSDCTGVCYLPPEDTGPCGSAAVSLPMFSRSHGRPWSMEDLEGLLPVASVARRGGPCSTRVSVYRTMGCTEIVIEQSRPDYARVTILGGGSRAFHHPRLPITPSQAFEPAIFRGWQVA